MSAHTKRPTLSVVIPIYNEERTLPELHRRLTAVLGALDGDYEIVFVNDGSRDASLELLRALGEEDRRIKVLSLSRNFGHQMAITAGIDHTSGDAVVVMDGDLQDPPEFIPDLVAKWRQGFDVVYAVRAERAGEPVWKKTASAAFYRFFAHMTQLDIPVDTGDFRLLSRRVVDHLKSLRESNRYIRGLTSWIGFRQVGLTYARDPRLAGDSKYPLGKLLRLGIDGLTSFSFAPLQASIYVGVAVALLCAVYTGFSLYHRIVDQTIPPGWTSTIVVILFLSAVQFIILGVYGEYIGRIYAEVKHRPLYIIDEQLNLDVVGAADTPRVDGAQEQIASH